MTERVTSRRRGSYGIDAPYAAAFIAVLTVAELVLAILSGKGWTFLPVMFLLAIAASCFYTTLRGKFVVWAEVLNKLGLRGDERILDLGCGRGAVLLLAAQHLTTGRAVGVDLWRSVDQSGNSAEATRCNAVAEGVADRVELHTADMTALPFEDNSFDLVVSSLAIHNIRGRAGREKAVGEAVRVLRPGGRLLIADIRGTRQHQAQLAKMGLSEVTCRRLGWRFWWGGPWAATRLVTATKPELGVETTRLHGIGPRRVIVRLHDGLWHPVWNCISNPELSPPSRSATWLGRPRSRIEQRCANSRRTIMPLLCPQGLLLLLAVSFVGCQHAAPVGKITEVGPVPLLGAFTGSKAGDQRVVTGIKLCWCPPGRFRMGSPPDEPERRPDEAQVEVTLTKGFWIGKYEVTQGQWQRVMGEFPHKQPVGEGDDFPVVEVNYGEAEAFCRKLTERARTRGDLPEGWEFRLPSEAQWEYACRAGTTTATAFGDKLSSQQANFQGKPYNGAEQGPSLKRATKVGSYPANPWGLHDMHGNVYEWCRDWYHQQLPGGDNPDLSSRKGTRNRDGTFSRVRRGGAWCDDGWPCRSAARHRFEPERHSDHIGFRVVAVQQ